MSAALRDYSLLWRAALAVRHPRTNAILCGMALFLAVLVGGAVLLATSSVTDAALIALRVAFAIFAFGCLMYYVPGVLKLSTPANAVLVPRMRRRARQLTTLAWLLAAGFSTLLAAGSPIPPYVVFLGTGLWLVALGLARGGRKAGQWIQFFLPLAVVFHGLIPRPWLGALDSVPVLGVAFFLLLALGAYTLETMFPNGGDRHFRLKAAQKLVTEQMSAEEQFRRVRMPRLGWSVYRAVLRRDCARRDAMALLMHVLGPAAHWSGRGLSLLLPVAGAALLMPLLRELASRDTLAVIAGGSWLFASSVLLVQLFDGERRMQRLSFTRGEQSLLRLAPPIPGAAAAFNRRFARRLLRTALAEWAMTSAAVLIIVALTGAPPAVLAWQAWICCLALPLVASNLRDHAHRAGSGGWRVFLWLLVSLAFSFLVGNAARELLGTPLLPGAALAALILAVGAVAWRWRRLVRAPHAFPVGRLA